MNNQQIVNNYLKALAFDNNIKTLENITKLIQAHVNTFAFSSLKVLLKEEISLELQDIYESLIIKKRGGYCFEHNKLFFEVLKTLGFDVEFYLARVVNNTNNEVPQTHRFTLLNYQKQRYLIDVGIGFRSPTVPIKFGGATPTPLGITYSINTFDDNTYALQTVNDKVFTVTHFDLNPCLEADFEMGHFYSHKNPCAVFVNNLVISLITKNEIRSLRNGDYFRICKDKEEKIVISTLEEFENILQNELNVQFTFEERKSLYTLYVLK